MWHQVSIVNGEGEQGTDETIPKTQSADSSLVPLVP